MAVGLWRPTVEVEAGGAAPEVCALAESFLDIALVGISPPPGATPEDFEATTRVNARLSQMRETLRGSEAMRKLGC